MFLIPYTEVVGNILDCSTRNILKEVEVIRSNETLLSIYLTIVTAEQEHGTIRFLLFYRYYKLKHLSSPNSYKLNTWFELQPINVCYHETKYVGEGRLYTTDNLELGSAVLQSSQRMSTILNFVGCD